MRKLQIIMLVVGLSLVCTVALAEDTEYLIITDPYLTNLTQEVFSAVDSTTIPKEASLAVDNDGSIYIIETVPGEGGGDAIFKVFTEYYNYHTWFARAINGWKIMAINFDHFGNMYCVLWKTHESNVGMEQKRIIKISGFPPLSPREKGPKK